MSRRQFTFRPGNNNAEHQRAWQILMSMPEGSRNSFLAQAILEKSQRERLEVLLHRVLKEELQNATPSERQEKALKPKQEIPAQMTDFLAGFMNQ